ncbi:MAG: hypothetical protein AB1646_00760 [Thermodesulfobacteriota bacterium]
MDSGRRRIGWLLVALCMVAPVASAAQDTPGDERLIEETLKLSGVTRQLEQLNSVILGAIPEDAFPDRKTRREAETVLEKEASSKELLRIVCQAVRDQIDRQAIEECLAFCRTPLGRKVGRVAGTALMSGALREIRESRNLLAGLPEERMGLLKRIVAAEQVVELNVLLLTEAVEGLVDGAEAEALQGQTRTHEARKRMLGIDSLIRAGKARTEPLAMTASAYTLKSLTDGELQSLAENRESSSAKWFRKALHEGFRQAVYHSANCLGRFIGQKRREIEQGSRGREEPLPPNPW